MARTVVLGAGISGHTVALHPRRMLGKEHEVVVVATFNIITMVSTGQH